MIRQILNRTILSKPLGIAESKQFKKDFDLFKELASKQPHRFDIAWQNRHPIMSENTGSHGFDRHYIYHTGWAARKLKEISPTYHVDISSSLYFNSIASAFIPIKFFDYRPAELHLTDLTCEKADLTNLPFSDNSVSSLSCMHVIEHIGLGRYGDPLNPNGDLIAFRELKRVLAPTGSILLVVPLGKPILQFNAQRIYSYDQIKEVFQDFSLVEFSLVPDSQKEGLIIHASKEDADKQDLGCGCFWFKK